MKKYYNHLADLLGKAKAYLSANKKHTHLAGGLAVIAVVLAVAWAGTSGKSAAVSDDPAVPSGNSGISSVESGTIPVVSLDGECLNDYTNWTDKSTYFPATMTFDDGSKSFSLEIEIKPQGTTSLYAPKKNFTLKLSEGVAFADQWGTQTKYVLKADYIDPTCSSNVVSAKLAAEMNEKYGLFADTPNYGVIDGFPVFVKINGEDAGIFNLTIPKDAWLFNMDADNPNHLVLACEGWSEASRMQSADIDYETDWSFEVGEPNEANKAAFERLVKFVSTADDKTFVEEFDQYLDLDACLNYICYINAAYAKDNVAKNMLMVTYDGKIWYPALYDLDSLWGINTEGTAPMEPDGTWPRELLANGNCLLYRVNYHFGDQLRERYQQLREGILSKEHILESFENYTAQIPQEYYDINNALWYTDGSRIRTLDLMSRLMDEYLPVVDQALLGSAAPVSTDKASAGTQVTQLQDSPIRYVWETNGVQQSLEDIEALPVAATIRYTLDGKEITPRNLTGKSGSLEMTLRVERKASADQVFGVAAVVQLDEAQFRNVAATGAAVTTSEGNTVCSGSAWLSATDSVCEMQLRMDVTDFDPVQYVIAVHPVYFADGGDDASLQALLSTAGELTAIINDGVALHTSLTEWNSYLTNVQNSLSATSTAAETLIPAPGTENADSVMERLLADAEAKADTLLEGIGYPAAANMTPEKYVQLLSQASADPNLTETEKAQVSSLLEQIGSYLVVVNQLNENRQTVTELNSALKDITGTMPDLVGAYAYANDTLYAILYRISTLYQNIANYYASSGGNDTSWSETGNLHNDVIIFTNYDIST